MKMKDVFETGSTVLVVAVAVIMFYYFLQDRSIGGGSSSNLGTLIPNWEEENESGIWIGPENAQLVVTEFMDFQCPFCSRLVPTLDSIATEFPHDVAIVFQHFPLGNHPHAVPAAIAAECAHRQKRFWPMFKTLFARQGVIGIEQWDAFALEARIGDVEQFNGCVRLPTDSFPRIMNGRRVGERTGVTGTPTTWLNGEVVQLSVELVKRRLTETGEGE